MAARVPGIFALTLNHVPQITPAAELIASYDGAHGRLGPCTREQWRAIEPFFREAMAPLSHLGVRRVRLTATPLVRLCVFALLHGAPLDLSVLLQPAFVEAFLATLTSGSPDARSALRRLADAHGLNVATSPLGYERRSAADPYTPIEIESLLAFARNVRTQNQRTSLVGLITLGAGAGLARDALRGVSAASLHHHGERPYVAAAGRCSYVLTCYRDDLEAVRAARPTGWLLGAEPRRNLTSHIVAWCQDRAGVPDLSPDRLRAMYLRDLLDSGLSLREVVASSGVRDLTRLYELAAPASEAPACPHIPAAP